MSYGRANMFHLYFMTSDDPRYKALWQLYDARRILRHYAFGKYDFRWSEALEMEDLFDKHFDAIYYRKEIE